jgi:hypothetical protein
MSKLIAYVIDGHELRIRPAPVERAWMDETDGRFAYRCLPLNIANAHGWEIACGSGFSARWDGFASQEAIRIRPDLGTTAPATGHFGHGVLTFHLPCLFQTDPGVDLFVTGPINRWKDAIAPMTGVIETDWAPYTFTMNWKFTRANTRIRFERDEPFCHVFPVGRSSLESVEPRIARLSDNPDLERRYRLWSENRNAFNSALSDMNSPAARERWQKTYFRGQEPDRSPGRVEYHRSRVRLRPFVKGGTDDT